MGAPGVSSNLEAPFACPLSQLLGKKIGRPGDYKAEVSLWVVVLLNIGYYRCFCVVQGLGLRLRG